MEVQKICIVQFNYKKSYKYIIISLLEIYENFLYTIVSSKRVKSEMKLHFLLKEPIL